MGTCFNALGQIDRNFDGQITVSDLFGTVSAIVNLPSGIMIDGLADSAIYRFLELSIESCTSNTAWLLSFMLWGVIIYVIARSLGYSDERAKKEYEDKKRDMGY